MHEQSGKTETPVAKRLVLLQVCLNDEKTFLFELPTTESVRERVVLIGAHHKVGEGLKIPGPRGGTTTARRTTTKIRNFLRYDCALLFLCAGCHAVEHSGP
jgi:hypothetical protein